MFCVQFPKGWTVPQINRITTLIQAEWKQFNKKLICFLICYSVKPFYLKVHLGVLSHSFVCLPFILCFVQYIEVHMSYIYVWRYKKSLFFNIENKIIFLLDKA